MLATLLGAPLTRGVDAALASAPPGKVAVIGDAGLARRLGSRGREAVLVGAAAERRGGGAAPLPFGDRELAAVVGLRLATADGWEALLAEWRRVVVPGGLVVLIDRGDASEPSRRALCGGLTDVAQRTSGRTVVTSGRVVHI